MKKTILAFDTNIWIYLAKEPELEPIFNQIKVEITSGSLDIIANDVILSEWKRNKDQTVKDACSNYRKVNDTIKKMSEVITNPTEKKLLIQIIKQYERSKPIEESVREKIEEIETLLTKCVCTYATDEQKLHIADLAMNNLPPFHVNKNNFNDALIVRNLCQYVSDRICKEGDATPQKYDFIYVSKNYKDFINPTTNDIYPDIINGVISNFRIAKTKELASALHLSQELIDNFDEWLKYMEQHIIDHMYLEWEIIKGK